MPSVGQYRLGIVGHNGYAGQVLHALSMQHPSISPVLLPARDLGAALPDALVCDVIALALPGEPAREWTEFLRNETVAKILDLSDAHRLDPAAHYGIPELFGSPPDGVTLLANPGCYPTATLLALRPLVESAVIEPEGIAVLGASGASGAGKGLADHLHFCNLSDNTFPYKVGTHRHIPEIEHHLGAAINFVTQLLPIARGMLVTAFVRSKASPAALKESLRARYEGSPYVTVLDEPGPGLGVRHVVGSHQALLAVGPAERSGLTPVFAAIDNLGRGAASQAVHNLNLWLGLEPHAGLPAPLPTPTGSPVMTMHS